VKILSIVFENIPAIWKCYRETGMIKTDMKNGDRHFGNTEELHG
jgi:hypothetical protein